MTRLPESCINVPGSMALAATGDPETTYLAGKLTGEELRSLGVNFNLAPSVDVNCNPANPIIGVRSYGDTPATVAKYAAGMIRGLQDGGVLCLAKHFPGHGDTSLDSHLTLPCVDKPRDELERMELAPFRAAIADGVPAIMTAHILFPALDDSGVPATMSRRIVTGLLRGEMSFTGLVTSDCMEMPGCAEVLWFGQRRAGRHERRGGSGAAFPHHPAFRRSRQGCRRSFAVRQTGPQRRWQKVWTAFWPLRPSWPPCPPPRLMRSGPPP